VLTLRAEIRDLKDNVATTATNSLTFTTDFGTLGTPNPVSAVKGRAAITLTSSQIGAANVTCTGAGLVQAALTVYFTGPASKLAVTAEPSTLLADGQAKAKLTAQAQDANGYPVPSFAGQLQFGTNAGTLVGTNPVGAVSGVAQIDLQAGSTETTATVTAQSAGLTTGSAQVQFVLPLVKIAQTHRARPGRQVSIPLLVRGLLPVAGVQATITYNPDLLAFVDRSKGALLYSDPDWQVEAHGTGAGKLTVLVWSGLKLKTFLLANEEPLVNLTFRVSDLAQNGNTTDLAFVDVTKLVDAQGEAITSRTEAGRLTVDTTVPTLSVQSCVATSATVSVQFSAAANAADAAAPKRYLLECPVGTRVGPATFATYDDQTHRAMLGGLTLPAGQVCKVIALGIRDEWGNALPDDGVTNVATDTVEGASSQTTLGLGWNLTGMPLEPTNPTSAAVFGDDLGQLVCYGWTGTAYVANPDWHVGRGGWVFVSGGNTTVDAAGTAPAYDTDFVLSLKTGWNIGSSPFTTHSVPLTECRVRYNGQTKKLTDAPDWVEPLCYAWDTQTGGYRIERGADAVLDPWEGNWLLALVDCDLLLAPIPPPPAKSRTAGFQPADNGLTTRDGRRSETYATRVGDWSLPLVASCGQSRDTLIAAVSRAASDGFDGYTLDAPKPPPGPTAVRMVFTRPGWGAGAEAGGGTFMVDTRGAATGQRVWDFEVTRTAGANLINVLGSEPVVLTWPDLSGVPNGCRLSLVDTATGKRRYLRTTRTHAFALAEGETRRFELHVEDVVATPLRVTGITALPTRGGGFTVSYQLSREANVRLQLRTPTGRVVLTNSAPTRSRAGTNALTLQPGNLPRGLYLLELIAFTEEGQAAKGVGVVQLR
jgi:hypothetical protein